MDPVPPGSDRRPTVAETAAEVHEVIPAREVLTELARGFLLVRDSDPKRAARFAATFLRERVGESPGRVTPKPVTVPSSFASLASPKRGAIDRGGFSRLP